MRDPLVPQAGPERPASGRAASRENAAEPVQVFFYLHPGRVFVSPRPAAVTTILGSCVAVCLWDSALGCGGVNHFLLPYRAGEGESSPRYGNVAIRILLDQMRQLGADPGRLRAKVFGGACVAMAARADGSHLGAQNVRLAEKLLAEEGIGIVGTDVGGDRGRKLIFRTDDGASWVKLL